MDSGKNMAGGRNNNRHRAKAYSVSVLARPQSSTNCSFCWLVLTLNPTLEGMDERDSTTFRAHLKKEHGLRDEIQP